ncbi:MAG: hypothetical protein HY909_08195 [Deltaproteobacteria bacterium]|nr:hypothetical protein [Deltaproteobacteria bacterium]
MPPPARRAPPEPLPRWHWLVAAERALLRSAHVAVAGAAVAFAAGLALARWLPSIPRAWALLCLVPALAPFAWLPRAVRRHAVALALTLDRRLGARAAVVTAVELHLRGAPETPFTARVTEDALRAVQHRPWRDALGPPPPTTLGAVALGFALSVGALAVPLKPAHISHPHPQQPTLRSPALASAAREALGALEAAAREDPSQARALTPLVEEARRLSEGLQQGMPRDEALERQDALERQAEEALAWALASERQRALDAALGALEDPSLAALREALARGDLRAADAAARALADGRERADRTRAEAQLTRAAEAARRAGAGDLAEALDAERALVQRRGARSELARELARALGDDPRARRVAEHLARGGENDASRALDEALQALDRELSPEERRGIAQALARLAREAPEGASREGLQRASRAPTAEELRAALRELARQLREGGPDRTPGGGARRAGDGALGALGRLRVGLQTGRMPGGGGGGQGSAHDEGHLPTAGRTPSLRAPGLTAPLDARRDPRTPAVPVGVERSDPTGERALSPAEVTLRQAAPAALQGIERAPVPEAYRAQVRGYFQTR